MARKVRKPTPVVREVPQPPEEEKPSQIENIISVALGLAVVLVIGAMIVNALRTRNQNQQTAQPTPTPTESQIAETNGHIVAKGETLWSIAVKYYNDGYKWPLIQQANKLPSGDAIEEGTRLIIPTLMPTPEGGAPVSEAVTPQTSFSPTPESGNVTGPTGPTGSVATTGQTLSTSTDKQYTVVKGDTLWDIAVRRYNNGYRWVDIAKMNRLANPDLIHPGNVFLMPD